jgi:2-dehydropantoate 2-reductase
MYPGLALDSNLKNLERTAKMKIAVIGTGAVGGYYGILLAKSGFDVHFLLNSDFDHVKTHGLYLSSVDGDIKLEQVNAYDDPRDLPFCDIVIVALKTTSNHLLKDILPHAAKPGGVLVMLQNGLGVEEQAQEILPGATVIGGLCFLCSNKTGPGHIRHLDYGSVRIGQYHSGGPAGKTDILKMVSDIFSSAAVAVEITGDLGRARWEKLAWNIPFNGMSVILDADTSRLVNHPASLSALKNVMLEVTGAARSCGYDIDDGFCDTMITATTKMVAYKPSMKLDHEAKRPLEIDMIYRKPIEAAEAAGYCMEKTRLLMNLLRYLDSKRF